MEFFQVAIKGHKPSPQSGLWETRAAAEREIRFLRADDRRHADEAMREAGIQVPVTEYEVVPVTR